MYSLPSTSTTRLPRPSAMNGGSPPTDLNARTGEFTPPGMERRARANSSRERASFIGRLAVVASVGGIRVVGVVLLGLVGLGGLGRRLLQALVLLRLGQALDRRHLLALLDAHDAHALGGTPLDGDAGDGDADDLAPVGDDDEVILVGDDAHRDHLAVARGGLDVDDAEPAAVLGGVLGERRALAVAA